MVVVLLVLKAIQVQLARLVLKAILVQPVLKAIKVTLVQTVRMHKPMLKTTATAPTL